MKFVVLFSKFVKIKRVTAPIICRNHLKDYILQSLEHGRRRRIFTLFYYPEYLETSDVETEIDIYETQEATDDFINVFFRFNMI